MITVDVKTGRPYRVYVGENLLKESGSLISKHVDGRVAVISDSHVAPLYLDSLIDSLRLEGIEAVSKVIPAGEKSKNIRIYEELLDFLAQESITRSDAVIALGGGVVGDIAGFTAATYLRGVPYIQIPTSLLAMVDSSVGGKTAIDLPAGKNLAGAFCQPELVICDPSVLSTLPEDIFRDGCAEVIKYGVLEDPDLFAKLTLEGIGFDRVPVITRCIDIKAAYVAEDEYDNGVRRKLNLGHTFGHAIEAVSRFSMTHGQAVAAGMCMVARASYAMGFCKQACPQGIEQCIRSFDLPVNCEMKTDELLPFIAADKKRRGDVISLIVPRTIGNCDIVPVNADDVKDWLEAGM